MTMMTTITTMSQAAVRPPRSGAFGGFVRWIATWPYGLTAHLNRRAAIKALRQMDDRELHDIGLVRSQIDHAVRGFPVDPDAARFW
jgi:uncharacterized protein YjiS (DUF1127 family)